MVSTRDGGAAWDRLRQQPDISLAIIDWIMHRRPGTLSANPQDPTLAHIYVIVLTARHEQSDIIRGLDAGADDYVVKPFDLEELRARIRVGVRLAALQERLAAKVAELEVTRDALERLARSDALTDLCSRRRWYELADAELARFKRNHRPFSILVADLDFFKRVNDTYGHSAGDVVLKTFAQLLRDETRLSDVVGRIGGEEFAILAPDASRESAEVI